MTIWLLAMFGRMLKSRFTVKQHIEGVELTSSFDFTLGQIWTPMFPSSVVCCIPPCSCLAMFDDRLIMLWWMTLGMRGHFLWEPFCWQMRLVKGWLVRIYWGATCWFSTLGWWYFHVPVQSSTFVIQPLVNNKCSGFFWFFRKLARTKNQQSTEKVSKHKGRKVFLRA